jgi:dolichol-phosphate mannosyltransferase
MTPAIPGSWRPARRTSSAFRTVLAFLGPVNIPLRPSLRFLRSTTAVMASPVTEDLLGTHSLTVIVPTRNESGNVAPLIARLDEALGDIDAEILFVDDSSDNTPELIRSTTLTATHPVRLLHRTPTERVGGLGGAVLAGLRSANGDWAVVIDGDLQHPPEVVPDLVHMGEESGADLVVASRYVGVGSAGGLSTAMRARVSGGANMLARTIFPRRLADCTDPMSGFFAVRCGSVELDRLQPHGFKILLETIARSPRMKVAEVPFVFQERHSGESKASMKEGLIFVRKLASLRVASVFGRHSRLVARASGFAAVGVTGILINSLALFMLVSIIGTNLLLGATLATQFSTAWNYFFTDWLVFRGPKGRSGWTRFLGFAAINNIALLLRLPLLSWLVHSVGVDYLMANVLTLIAAFVLRFRASDRYLFRTGAPTTLTPNPLQPIDDAAIAPLSTLPDRPVPVVKCPVKLVTLPCKRSALLPYRYNVHGIVTIGSAVILHELVSFSAPDLEGPLDIEIRPGEVGDGGFRRRTRVTKYITPAAVSYEEHLGHRGADFSLEMGNTIQVVVGPMLVRSPHVLYTNIVEALLRFVMIARGYMLLHSACLELNGRGVMLSALTDTGKTGTILRLLRETESKFLSDDMTILGPDGIALTYPKPLTISQHTLRAVNAGDLTKTEWRSLRVQSRLHSKEGRGIGTRLGDMNLPIMSLNAFTQYVVPPPKYDVDRLVPCEHSQSVQVEELFIIERNEYALTELDPLTLLDELIANTDDAYGFPPFRYFAPALVVGGLGYEELRAKERNILGSALHGVRARRLATPDFSWADHIPALTCDGTRIDLHEANGIDLHEANGDDLSAAIGIDLLGAARFASSNGHGIGNTPSLGSANKAS